MTDLVLATSARAFLFGCLAVVGALFVPGDPRRVRHRAVLSTHVGDVGTGPPMS